MNADTIFKKLVAAHKANKDCFATIKEWYKGCNTLQRFEILDAALADHAKAFGYTRSATDSDKKAIASQVAKYRSVIRVYYSERKTDGKSFREVYPTMDFAQWIDLGLSAMESYRKSFRAEAVTIPPMDSAEILREVEKAETVREAAQEGIVDTVMNILKIAGHSIERKVVVDSYSKYVSDSKVLAVAEAKTAVA